jgi:hypothetical protein
MSPVAVIALSGWAAGVAVLAFAVVAKLSDWPQTKGRWPVRSALAAPGPVTAVEAIVVIAAVLPLATVPRFIAVTVVYFCYTVAAVRLRGRDCACFGSRLTSRFTPWHAVGCAAVAGLSALAATVPAVPVLVATTAAAGAGAAGAVLPWLLRQRRYGHGDVIDARHIDRIVIYGSDSCPVCTMLWDQQDHYRSFAGCPVEFRKDKPGDATSIATGRYPAAAAVGPDGSVLHGPVFGLGQIRDLLRITAVQVSSGRGGDTNARIRNAGRDRLRIRRTDSSRSLHPSTGNSVQNGVRGTRLLRALQRDHWLHVRLPALINGSTAGTGIPPGAALFT